MNDLFRKRKSSSERKDSKN